MLRYIGDISKQDSVVLERYARGASNILEFGVGASTQVFAQSASDSCKITSLDTSDEWINKTKDNFTILNINKEVTFKSFKKWKEGLGTQKFDLIFNDGFADLRQEFCRGAWDMLAVGGNFLAHDTRSRGSFNVLMEAATNNYLEVEHVLFNVDDSNITVIKRKLPAPYRNWNIVEGRTGWERGIAKPPSGLWGKQ